jgi:CelD/BcsL family acetyltransferase involved in cellulose biosynthesis
MTHTNFTIDIVDNASDFAAMRDEWTELLASSSSDCLFLTWEWLHTWWIHFANHRRLFIVTVRSESQLVAIAPLTSRRIWVGPLAVPILEFAGTGTIGSDYLDVIVRQTCETEALDALTGFLADKATTMRLPRISESSGLATTLGTALSGQGWECAKVATEVCPFIDLSSRSWEDYLASLGPSHRYNFKRRLKNLTRDYDVRIRYAESDDDRREALRQVVNLHLQRWTPRGGSDAFDSAGLVAFHDDLSQLARERGWLRMMVITLDGRPAAAFYGFRYRDRFLFYQSGFDPAFVRSSVGLVMVGLTIRDAIGEGASEYDMLHGDESYKFLWTKTVRQLIRLDVYPPGRLGRMHSNAARVTAGAKRFAKRILRVEPATTPLAGIQS